YAFAFPRDMREKYFKEWHEENDAPVGKEPISAVETYKGNDYDDVKPHLWRFFQSVKSRQPVVEDALFGHNAALACHMANESYFRKSPVVWDAASGTIKNA